MTMRFNKPRITDYGKLTDITAGGTFRDLTPALATGGSWYGGSGSGSGSNGSRTGGISGAIGCKNGSGSGPDDSGSCS